MQEDCHLKSYYNFDLTIVYRPQLPPPWWYQQNEQGDSNTVRTLLKPILSAVPLGPSHLSTAPLLSISRTEIDLNLGYPILRLVPLNGGPEALYTCHKPSNFRRVMQHILRLAIAKTSSLLWSRARVSAWDQPHILGAAIANVAWVLMQLDAEAVTSFCNIKVFKRLRSFDWR